jgi:hypothetical protein
MLIRSAAYFEVCGCEHHGRIVTATGEHSIVFCSKKAAHEALSVAVKENTVAADERLIVSSQIDASSLAEEECDVSIDTQIKTETINAIHETIHEMWLEKARELPQSRYVD